MDEQDLTHCVAEMARCIGAQDWSRLAAFCDPGCRGEDGRAGWEAGEEALARMRAEAAADGLTVRGCDLTPRVLCASPGNARAAVSERLELRWPDGCRRVIRREWEQCWQRGDAGWRLRAARALPGAVRVHEEAALRPFVEDRLREAQRYLQPEAGVTRPDRWRAAAAAEECNDIVLPPRLTVAVGASQIPASAGEALRRACGAAVAAWNHSLRGVIELVEHTGPDPPDILLRGWPGPVFGDTLGLYLVASTMRRSRRRARRAELRISVLERAGGGALCLSPPELSKIVCHELGHCFGLAECARHGRVMACCDRTAPLPQAPFVPERRAVVGWLGVAYGLLANAYRGLDRSRDAAAASERAAALMAAAELEPGCPPHPICDLLAEAAYAPAPLRHYWLATAAARERRFAEARAHLERASAEGVCPELLLRRAPLQPSAEARLADLRRAMELDPNWLIAHQCLLDWLERCGPSQEAAAERERGRRLRWRAEREQQLLVAKLSRCPWETTAALLRAAERSLRLGGLAAAGRLHRR